ncbi:MAG TPA: alcohol dehydrogenase catalytic domain-containing protein [Anaerovoracaceae bacterium]|nr:alcohol dehydrogenase catalytic domain-containing protein [Anaerovoracaceae bacterium]
MKLSDGPGHVEIRDIPYPVLPSQDWVVVKVKASGICGSDMHIYHGSAKFWPPFAIGHEFSGEIAEMGRDVKDWAIGDRVVCETHTLHCGTCRLCREGKIQYCASKRPVGFGVNGGFAEYVAIPAMFLHRIPDNVSYEVAALAEPLTITINQIAEKGLVTVSDYAVVLGSGAIGILSGFVAKTMGARKVLMTGLNVSEKVRFPAALKVGVDETFNSQTASPVEYVLSQTNSEGADVILEASGSAIAINQGIEMIRKTGKFACIGMSGKDTIEFPYNTAMRKGLTLYYTFSTNFSGWDRAMYLMSTTPYDLSALITHRVKLEDFQWAFSEIENENAIKAIFTFD